MRVDDVASNIRPSLPMRVALVRGRRRGAQQGQAGAARQLLLVLGPDG